MTVGRRTGGFVSANDHLVLPPDAFAKRLPAKHRERGPRVVPVDSAPSRGVLDDFLSEKGLGAAREQTGTGADRPGDAWIFDGQLYPTASSSLVDDVDGLMRRGIELGATEASPAEDWPGIGRGGYLLDPDRNLFGLISPVLSDGTVAMGEGAESA